MASEVNTKASSPGSGGKLDVENKLTQRSTDLNKSKLDDSLVSSSGQRDISTLSAQSTQSIDLDALRDFTTLSIPTKFVYWVVFLSLACVRLIPFYDPISNFLLSIVHAIYKQIENVPIVHWAVLIVEGALESFLAVLRKYFPEIAVPPSEMFDTTWTEIQQQTMIRMIKCSASRWSQGVLRALEKVLRFTERCTKFLAFNDDDKNPSWLYPNMVFGLYRCTFGRMLDAMAIHIEDLADKIRTARRVGHRLILQNNRIRNRRKVSPRKFIGNENPTFISSLYWFTYKILVRVGLVRTKVQLTLDPGEGSPGSPNERISTEDKKRKLSDIEEENLYERKGWTYHVLMADDLSSELSEDPDFEPSSEDSDSSTSTNSEISENELLPDGVDVEVPHPKSSSPKIASPKIDTSKEGEAKSRKAVKDTETDNADSSVTRDPKTTDKSLIKSSSKDKDKKKK